MLRQGLEMCISIKSCEGLAVQIQYSLSLRLDPQSLKMETCVLVE